jgi:hypothetical protein
VIYYLFLRSLFKLQTLYGIIPNIKSIGTDARHVLQSFMHLRKEEDGLRQRVGMSGGGYNQDETSQFREAIDTLVV